MDTWINLRIDTNLAYWKRRIVTDCGYLRLFVSRTFIPSSGVLKSLYWTARKEMGDIPLTGVG